MPRFRVAIIGGGIAGLTFALALSKHSNDIAIDVYESGGNFSEFGAGLNLWPRVLEVLHKLGLEEDLKQYTGPSTIGSRFDYYKGDQNNAIFYGKGSLGVQAIHRAEFLRLLVKHTSSICKAHFLKKLDSYNDLTSGPVTLHFKDGSTASCDVLIGADGVKSAVRAAMYHRMAEKASEKGRPLEEVQSYLNCVDPKWSGEVIYRSLVPSEILEEAYPNHPSLKAPLYFTGKHKFVITYPVSQGQARFINTGALVARHDLTGTTFDGPWSTLVNHEELTGNFQEWDPQVRALMNLMKSPSRWAVNTVDNLPTFVSGRVALIGDAAHSMTTHQASGAGQAVEDAFVLAILLALPQTVLSNIPSALTAYDDVRRPVAQGVQRRSYDTGKILFLENLDGFTAEMSKDGSIPSEILARSHDELQDMYQWTSSSALTDLDRAVNNLHNRWIGGNNPSRRGLGSDGSIEHKL